MGSSDAEHADILRLFVRRLPVVSRPVPTPPALTMIPTRTRCVASDR